LVLKKVIIAVLNANKPRPINVKKLSLKY